MERLTKRQRRSLRQQDVLTEENHLNPQKFRLSNVNAKTYSQKRAVEAYCNGQHLLLHGYAGTGKTFLGMYLALSDVVESRYKRLVIVRSAVPTRDVGFLPGTLTQKMEIYELPYKSIANNLFRRGDAYDILKNKDMLQFISTSYVRGTTIDDCVVLVDEINNMTFHELDSIITRMGEDTKLIMCGDFRQSDLRFSDEQQGLGKFMDILDTMSAFERIEFTQHDIVRSPLVKEYIIAKTEKGYA